MPEVANHPPGTFSWVDLTTPDSAASQAFYTALMGWEAIDIPAGEDFFYTLLSKNIKSVAGMAEMSPDDQPSGWKLYVAASDLDATVAKAAELGGTVLMPPMDVMTMVRIAMVQDPSGAMVALWQGLEFIGADLVREPGTLSWSELYTHETAATAAFYEGLFGWNSIEATTPDGGDYTVFMLDGAPVAGMMAIRPEWGEVSPGWIPYFAVPDIGSALDQVRSLGGQVQYEPMTIPQLGDCSLISDPHNVRVMLVELAETP